MKEIGHSYLFSEKAVSDSMARVSAREELALE